MAAVVTATGVPFQEAIDLYRGKVALPTRTWTDLWEGMHARAFVVAGAMKAELLADFHGAVTDAIAKGQTLADFRKEFDRIVSTHGWDYKGGRNWRSGVIYDTNMRMAHAAGRWAQAQRLAASERAFGRTVYLRYSAVQDDRTRPEHRAWHDIILPIDHPFWDTHTPPNGWKCRCIVQVLTERAMRRRGLKPTAEADLPTGKTHTHRINTPEGTVTIDVPEGIDPGFAYNPGAAAYGRGADLAAARRHGPFREMEAPGGDRPAAPPDLVPRRTSTKLGPAGDDEDGLRDALRAAIGGDERILQDPTGARVSVGQAIVDHMLEKADRLDGRERFFPLVPELIEDPQEIWVGFATDTATGRVALRRRYVSMLRLRGKRVIGLIADLDGHRFAGMTFFRGGPSGAGRLRSGLRVHAADATTE